MPWLSLAGAVGAGAASGGAGARAQTALRTLALGALAVFAYFRWIAPAAIPLALVLETAGQAALPRDGGRWRRLGIVFPIASWLVLAELFWTSGEGRLAVFADAAKAALLLVLLTGVGFGLRRIWRRSARPRTGIAAAAAALVAMAAMALTLDWGLWPALVGTAAILASQAVALAGDSAQPPGPSRLSQRAAWALEYAGYAAVAYAFLR